MKALNWAAALASWTFGVVGLFGWFIQSAAASTTAASSTRGELLSSADLLLAVGAAGMALNLVFLVRGEREARREEER
ncbi:MAG: hypothetical protein JRN56_02785 [Nitrososphaerota archaeon]|jgi:hypothetical protein|nr:hypothetical protein [Nitrososphaerota archaeon]MDG6912553.1 hypothetical protein [Nitrososphaerota archaeon]MDG6937628.1 hypothetical protein [Nitrososphaerota archaeon]MDG6962046.1 hypothetical protein [Nitrososphaerota archaeon]MDG6970604.1 hypothetical protein [Nitrososphaerota archaeon]